MKYRFVLPEFRKNLSHPSRGAWVEMSDPCAAVNVAIGRTPRGVRGLK